MGKSWPLFLLTAALIAPAGVAGCGADDRERLAGVGRKLAEHLQDASAETGARLTRGWNAARGEDEDLPLDTRVSLRLRYDKHLPDTSVAVTAHGGEVELRGKVRDAEQRRRAFDLAESTAGVDKVTDALEESRDP
jgi:osmotically-inducible protein OsmY